MARTDIKKAQILIWDTVVREFNENFASESNQAHEESRLTIIFEISKAHWRHGTAFPALFRKM